MINLFKDFLADKKAFDMFIEGQAGTGKTTSLAQLVQHCIDSDITYIVCAHTHKACTILEQKLPEGACVSTTHSYIKKRPTINEYAKSINTIEKAKQHSKPKNVQVLFIDEFSLLGEEDWATIGELQDPDATGIPITKVVYIGDPNQIPPVNDVQAIKPSGKYHIKLTKVWRQEGNSDLLDILSDLVQAIEGTKQLTKLEENNSFKRGIDLVDKYNELDDKILLAYTNRRVQDLNAVIQGRDYCIEGDTIAIPALNDNFVVTGIHDCVDSIYIPYNGATLALGSKYKTLEYLNASKDIKFFNINDEFNIATIFGYDTYNEYKKNLAIRATVSNKNINHDDPKAWSLANKNHPLAIERRKAWRALLTFKDCVVVTDFTHATTVHKSQGTTYKNVLIDIKDIARCREYNYNLYLRLLYVAISRASNNVYTN